MARPKKGNTISDRLDRLEALVVGFIEKQTKVAETEIEDTQPAKKGKKVGNATLKHKKGALKKKITSEKTARRERFDVNPNRPNLFEKNKELFNAHRDETKTDKILNRNKKPVPRRDVPQQVEVECKKCEDVYEINENLVPMDGIFICDNCAGVEYEDDDE